jgi:hypothetical protein
MMMALMNVNSPVEVVVLCHISLVAAVAALELLLNYE